MHSSAFTRDVLEAVEAGINRLLSQQAKDGCWRDYDLLPGMSEAWSTAWVSWCLAQAARRPDIRHALERSARALAGCRRNDGWGYNRTTGADADSTAWTVRFLALIGAEFGLSSGRCLEKFLDVHGRAHTFLEPNAGSWGDAHADVTPMIGLALQSIQPLNPAIKNIRLAVIRERRASGVWTSFWWPTDAYATAWSLEFLAQTGGISDSIRADAIVWLREDPSVLNAFELSLRLFAAVSLNLAQKELASALIDRLLNLQIGNDGWAPSAFLRVPKKSDYDVSSSEVHPDLNGLMTTALATAVLGRWLRATIAIDSASNSALALRAQARTEV